MNSSTGNNKNAYDLIYVVLAFASKTKKRIALSCALCFFALISMIAYVYSDEIKAGILAPLILKAVSRAGEDQFIASLNETKFKSEIPHLLRRSDAIATAVWSVDLINRTRRIVYTHDTFRDPRDMVGAVMPLYGTDTNSLAIIRMQEGEVMCVKLNPESEYGDYLMKQGARFMCGTAVPHQSSQFIGMITAAYRYDPVMTPTFKNYFTFASKQITYYGSPKGRPKNN